MIGASHDAARRRTAWLSLLLVACTLAVYWPVRHYDFVNYDDEDGIVRSPQIRNGLSWNGVKWAFGHPHMGNWQPLTNLSHMLDCQWFGLRAGSHHLVNVVFHCANTVLLFLLLRVGTGSTWIGFFVAALFGWHPLHVESVAWVSERKDVLSTFWGLAGIAAYLACVRTRVEKQDHGPGRDPDRMTRSSSAFYAVSVLSFALSLMSKPMLVTLPFLLLLLDFWPLRRIEFKPEDLKARNLLPLLLEKLPYFVLASVASTIAIFSQYRSDAVETLSWLPMAARFENAVVSCIRYLQKTFWPAGLTAFYPRVQSWPLWHVAGAVVVLVLITVVAVRLRRARPYFLVGWLWFLGALVPVIGIVQVGAQAMADRYTYVPLIGIFIIICWGAVDVCNRVGFPRPMPAVLASVAGAACLYLTSVQVRTWENSVALFTNMLRINPDNALAHNNLGSALYHEGKTDEAISEFAVALRLSSQYDDANNNMGIALFRLGQNKEASEHFVAVLRKGPNLKAMYNLAVLLASDGKTNQAKAYFLEAARRWPDCVEAQTALGTVLAAEGKPAEAKTCFEAAVRSDPGSYSAHIALGRILQGEDKPEEALSEYAVALSLNPESAEAHHALGLILEQRGRIEEATEHYQAALAQQPGLAEAHNNLSNLLARQGRTDQALEHAHEAVRLKPEWAQAHYNLANALFLQKTLGEAVSEYREALRLKPDYVEVHQNLGFALEKLEKYREAAGEYSELIRLRPDHFAAYRRLAAVQMKDGRTEDALKTANEGVRLATAAGQQELARQIEAEIAALRTNSIISK